MKARSTRLLGILALVFAIMLTACGDDDSNNGSTDALPGEDFDRPVVFADLGWDTALVNNRIAQFILENGWGYDTEAIPGETITLLQGLINGDVDIYMEVTVGQQPAYPPAVEDGSVIDLGLNFDGVVQEWYVPTYVIEGDEERGIEPMAPDLRSVADLPKYADLFEDPEDPSKGRFFDCIAGWECEKIDEAKFEAYGLNDHYNRFLPGSGAALATSLVSAYERGEPWLGYYWAPTWIYAQLDLTPLEEPEYTDECWDQILSGDEGCAYPETSYNIAVNPEFADAAPEVIEFLETWQLSIDDVSGFLLMMQEEDLDHEQTALAFLNNRDDLWTEWVPDDVAERVQAALDDN